MKKLICLILTAVLTLCSCINGRAMELTREMRTEASLIKEESGEIMRCLQENDREGLKSLFCEKTRGDSSFDSRIDRIFELIGEGFSSCEFDINTTAGGGKGWTDGEVSHWDVCPDIPHITFFYDGGEKKYFALYYYWKIVDREHPEYEGIQHFTFMYLNVENAELGKSWS